jgi:hypothetical protein
LQAAVAVRRSQALADKGHPRLLRVPAGVHLLTPRGDLGAGTHAR